MRRKVIPALLFLFALSCSDAPARQRETTAPSQSEDSKMPQEQHVVASPNPTIDDGKTREGVGTGKIESAKIQPARVATAAPLETTATKPKRRRRARPRTD